MTASAQPRQLDARLRVSRGDFQLEVDLEVSGQQTAVLLGPNGAGKSTVVDALAGVCPIDAGRIVVDGVVVDEPATSTFVPVRQRGLGIVFQQYRLYVAMKKLVLMSGSSESHSEAKEPSRYFWRVLISSIRRKDKFIY